LSESQPRELADRVEINDLLIDYCRYIDRAELGSLVALFTENCVVEYGPGAGFSSRGRAVLERDLQRVWRFRRTAHHLSNIQIHFKGMDHASVVSSVMAWHESPDRSTALLYGRYDDDIIRTRAGWRISRRKLTNVGGDPVFDEIFYPGERAPAPAGWSWRPPNP
jgi:3-phenylpropionate/cinnamic acid dioxygenase small subunit